MDTRVKPAYDGFDVREASRKPHPRVQRRTAREFLRLHRLLAGALQFENPNGALLAGDRQAVIEQLARCARSIGDFTAQDLDPRRRAFEGHLAPGAWKRRQAVNVAKHVTGRPVPVDPCLGFLDFLGVTNAFLTLWKK